MVDTKYMDAVSLACSYIWKSQIDADNTSVKNNNLRYYFLHASSTTA